MDPVLLRERNVFIAKMAESTERYEDVIQLMKEVTLMNVELTTEERDLMSAAYHKVIASRKSAWKTLVAFNVEQKQNWEKKFEPMIREYIQKVEGEIIRICSEVTSVLNHQVLPHCTSPENQVFYYTMMGDCYRYIFELDCLIESDNLVQNAMIAYGNGVTIAEERLNPAHPIRLSLALNFSVFHYDALEAVENARDMAQNACDEARPLLSTIDIQARLRSEQILNILSSNLARWDNAH